MSTPDPAARDEAALAAQLTSMAGLPAAPEMVLRQLASVLFPGGAGGLEHVTWPERDAGDDRARVRAVADVRPDPQAQAEARLRTAEARYQTLVEQIPAVTFMVDLGDGKNEIYVSPHIETLLGFTQAEWLEDPFLWYQQLHPDDRALWIEEFARGCRTGGPFRCECRFLARDARVVWVRGEARLIKDELGRPLFLQGVAFDITESKRAQEVLLRQAVRTTEERYRDVVQGIGAIFWEADASTLRFTFVSPQAEQILGVPAERWLAEPEFWLTLIHPDDRQRVAADWRASARDGVDRAVEYRAITATGDPIWLQNRVHVVRDEAGRPRQLLGLILDVSDRKRADEERVRLLDREQEARVEAETLNLIGRRLAADLDLQKVVQAVVDAGGALTGAQCGAFFYRAEDERGESYMLYALSGAPREAFEKFAIPGNTALFEPTFRGEGIIRLDDVRVDPRYGMNAPFTGMPLGQLPVTSYLAVPVVSRSRDVLGGLFFGHPEPGRFTERHERMLGGLAAQAAVAMDNARLYKAADEARRVAEEANRAKDEFLATLSHELRTPLTAILGWARILLSGRFDTSQLSQAIAVIERNASAQAQLIEDLLDVSRIIVGKLQLNTRPIENLEPLVEAIVDSFRPAAQAKQIDLATKIDRLAGPIEGDRDRLQQVVWNLLSNAIKFTPPGGRVEVRCERREAEIELRVSDTGKGISAAFLPHLFDRFAQADSTATRAHRGLGLGLAIVRHLVELHGGTVHAASRGEGQGSTFTVRLPIAGGQSDIKQPLRLSFESWKARALRPKIQGVRVLVVEDEDDSRALLATIFEGAGALVEAVSSAGAAFQALKRFHADVLVCDLGLPGQDGYDLIRTLRALEAGQGGRIPGVAVTAYASRDDRDRALAAGFQAHVTKPIDPTVLVEVVAGLHQPRGR
jgi:PAS domain S-box-containing protein